MQIFNKIFNLIIAYPAYFWFLLFSLIAIVITVYDKIISKKRGKKRIPEATLLVISALGGSLAMYLTMLFIRHKTKHMKFMIGIPVIMALQIAAIVFIVTKF